MKSIMITIVTACGFLSAVAQPKLTATQQQATDLFRGGKPDEAIPLFKKAIAENAKDKYSINALDIIYYNSGRYSEAYEVSGKGIAASGGEIPFVDMHAKAAFQLKKYTEVIQLADDYNKKQAPDADLLYIKGMALQAGGDASGAVTAYSQSIAAKADYAAPYLARGKYFSELGRIAPALKDYDKYISLQPDDFEGYSLRGVAYYNSGRFDEAFTDYNKALALNPKDHYSLFHRGEVYAARKESDKALADFNMAIVVKPDYPDTYCQLARLYVDIRQAANAILAITKAIELDANRAEFYDEKSRDLNTLDRYAEALAAAEKAIALAPKDGEGYMWKALSLANADKQAEGIATATAGIAVAPGYYLLYAVRASLYRQQGNTTLADADDAKAKELAAK